MQALRLSTGRTAHRGSRGVALPFHDHGTRRGEGVSVTPRPLFAPGKTRYPLYRRLGEPQGRSGQVRKISPPPGFDPRTLQPVASRYTDYATRPTVLGDESIRYLPPLHIKFGLIRISVQAMDKWSEGFGYLKQTFPKISEANMKEGIFFRPQITHLFENKDFSKKIKSYWKKGLEGIWKCLQILYRQRISGILQWNCAGSNFVPQCYGVW